MKFRGEKWKLLLFLGMLFLIPFSFAVFPQIQFADPTPSNQSIQTNSDIFVNLTTTSTEDYYSFTDFNSDLLLWMGMDDLNSSGDPIDLSTYANNGSFLGDDINSTGYWGNASWFDGIDDNSNGIYIGETQNLNLSGNFTISAWANSRQSSQIYQAIFARGSTQGGTTNTVYNLVFTSTASRPRITVSNGTALITLDAPAAHTIVSDRWYMVTTTYNGTTLSLYINGTNVASNVDTDFGYVWDHSARDETGIGGDFDNLRSYFNGSIDEVLVFKRSLSAGEINSLYNASSNNYENNFTELTQNVTHKFTGYSVDIQGDRNNTGERHVFIGSDSLVPNVTLNNPTNGTTYQDTQVTVNFTVVDNTFVETKWFYNGSTNITYTDVTYQNLSDGSHTFIFYANDTSGNLNDTTTSTFTVNTSQAITFSNLEFNPANGTNYSEGAVYLFNVTTSGNVDTVYIEWQGTNFTDEVLSLGSDVYQFNRTNLGSDTYNYTWWANNTNGVLNGTTKNYYTITKAYPNITLYLNNSLTFFVMESNETIEGIFIRKNDSIWINATSEASSGAVTLYNNGSLINDVSVNVSNFTTFDVNSTSLYNITAFFQENQNYTFDSDTKYVRVLYPQAIGRWNVVPFQVFNKTFEIGVVAFHISGIDKVEFIYSNLTGVQSVNVSSLSLNPRTGVGEYWTNLTGPEFKEGAVEINATIYPNDGEVRHLRGQIHTNNTNLGKGEYSLTLNANSNNSLWNISLYVDSESGSDSTGNGSLENPFKSMSKAARNATLRNPDGSADGTTIYLLAGNHTFGFAANDAEGNFIGYPSTTNRYIEIVPAPGLNKSDVFINGSSDGLRTKLIKLTNLTVIGSISNIDSTDGSDDVVWLDNVVFLGTQDLQNVSGELAYRHTDYNWIASGTGDAGTFVTNSNLTGSEKGIVNGASLIRNLEVEGIGGDAVINAELIINLTVNDLNPYRRCNDGVDNDGDGDIDFSNDAECSSLTDDGESTAGFQDAIHTDTIQYFVTTPVIENYIVYGLKATNVTGQGWHIDYTGHDPSGGPWKDFAMVNILNIPTTKTYWLSSIDHLLLWHVTISTDSFLLSNTAGIPLTSITDLSIRNSVLTNLSYSLGYPNRNSTKFINNHLVEASAIQFGVNDTNGTDFDVLFNDTSLFDYHPNSTSILRNRIPGNGSQVVPYDLDGSKLPTDGTASIGALQFLTADSSDTTAPSVTLHAPVNFANVSSANQSFNASFTDGVQLANSTFYLWNSTGDNINTTTKTVTGTSNETNLTVSLPYEGNFTWNYLVYDNSSNSDFASSNFTIIYDMTPPNASYVAPTNSSGVEVSRNYIEINVTGIDSNSGLDVILIRLYNASQDQINSSSSTTSPLYVNFSELNDGVYFYNASVNDTSGNVNNTETRNITLTTSDTTNPEVTINVPTTTTHTSSSINFNISLNENGTSWFNIDNVTNITMTSQDEGGVFGLLFNYTNTSIADGSYVFYAFANDTSGNNNFTEIVSFSVDTSSSGNDGNGNGGGGSGGGSGSGGGTPIGYWVTTFIEDDEDLSVKDYVIRLLKERQRIRIKVNGEEHHVGIVELTNLTATINVSSKSNQAVLEILETKKFDVDDDNVYDLAVLLRDLNNEFADLFISYIQEEVLIDEENNTIENDTEGGVEEYFDDGYIFKELPVWVYWSLFGVVLVLIILVIVFRRLSSTKSGTRRKT